MKIKGFQNTINWYKANANTYTKGYYQYKKSQEFSIFASLIPKGGKVLDAGCAAGRDSKYLVEEGLDIVGIDLVDEFIAMAKKHVPEGRFIQGSFLDLPFENQTFDGVWANASLLHFETINEVRKALTEFHRVLKDKGVLHVKVKAQIGSKKFEIVKDNLSKHDRFFQFFIREEVKELITDTGFQLIRLEQYDEQDKFPDVGRKGVEWIWCLARKL